MGKITKSDIKSYIRSNGIKCLNPECSGNDLQGGPVEIDGGEAWQEVTCSECGRMWTDIYKLSGVSNIN